MSYYYDGNRLVYRCKDGRLEFMMVPDGKGWKPSELLERQFEQQKETGTIYKTSFLELWAAKHKAQEITETELNAKLGKAPPANVDPCSGCLCPGCDNSGCTQYRCDKEAAKEGGCIDGCSGWCHDYRPATANDAQASPAPAPAVAQRSDDSPAEPAAQSAFDYAALDQRTADNLRSCEAMYLHGKRMAETGLRAMADAVAMAHDELCTVVHNVDNGKTAAQPRADGRFGSKGEDTFRTWCDSIGVGKTTAYKLLQVSNLLAASTPQQQKLMAELSPSLLYAAAKPSAPAELVEGVKNGDITSNKQYQELLTQLKEAKSDLKAVTDRSRQVEEVAKVSRKNSDYYKSHCEHLTEELERAKKELAEKEPSAQVKSMEGAMAILNGKLEEAMQAREQAEQNAREAEGRAKTAEHNLKSSQWLKDSLQSQLESERRRSGVLQDGINNIRAELNALKARPIETVAADADDIARWKAEAVEEYKRKQAEKNPVLVLCKNCVYQRENRCSGLCFDPVVSMEEENEINKRLHGCTAGIEVKETKA